MLTKRTTNIKLDTNSFGQLLDMGIISINSDGKISEINAKARELLELTEQETSSIRSYRKLLEALVIRGDYGQEKIDNIVAENINKVTTLANTAAIGEPTRFECHYALPSGSILHIKTLIGHDRSLLIAIEDTTQESIKNQTLLAALDMGSSGYVYYCLAQKKVKYHSNYFKKLLTDEERKFMKRDGIRAIIHPDDVDRVNGIWQLVSTERTAKKLYLRCNMEKHGQVWYKVFFCPQLSTSGIVTGITCYFTDVTETLSIEGALRMSKKSLEKALQLKTDFISRVSHEVRTPMNAMVGIADALINHHHDPEITPKLQLIQDSSVNILRILDETLDYAKLEAAEIKIDSQPADPAIVVTRVCTLWQEIANRKSVTLNYKIDPSVPQSLVFDAHRYEQCLNNLVSNAIKFAEGGKVDVLLTRLQKGNNPAQLVLAVKDNGIGMTPDQEKNLFEPFKQADTTISKRYGGTGLGMKITRDIIGLMNGKISVKTSPGKGTIIMIALPLDRDLKKAIPPHQEKNTSKPPALKPEHVHTPQKSNLGQASNHSQDLNLGQERSLQPRQKASSLSTVSDLTGRIMDLNESQTPFSSPKQDIEAETPPESSHENSCENLKVLVVDDNATNHLVVQSLLQGLVGTIYVANNGQEALDVLEVKDVDVVFMDIHMPIMDGIEATLAIRNSSAPWSNVRIVALTADPLYQQKRLCMNIGMDYALAKPVKLADLREALDATRDREPHHNLSKKAATL